MKNIIVAALLAAVAVSAKADSYFQHASLAPSNIQGQVIIGAMKTNAGYSQETILPLFYRNAAPTDPWYKPSFAPLACGWSAGGHNISGGCGVLLDVGPQLIMVIEGAAGIFSGGKASVVNFFDCSASATACGAISTGVIGNLNIQDSGKFSNTWKELGAHPLGFFIGPSVRFGGALPAVAAKRKAAKMKAAAEKK